MSAKVGGPARWHIRAGPTNTDKVNAHHGQRFLYMNERDSSLSLLLLISEFTWFILVFASSGTPLWDWRSNSLTGDLLESPDLKLLFVGRSKPTRNAFKNCGLHVAQNWWWSKPTISLLLPLPYLQIFFLLSLLL